MIKIILIEDHELVRAGIKEMLQDTKGIQVVAEAATGIEGINLVRNLHLNVVVLDFHLPDMTGLEVTSRMLRINPELKILIVTSAINDWVPSRLIQAGVQGYLTKDATRDELVRAIKAVNVGQSFISSKIVGQLALSKKNFNPHAPFNALSSREIEVMMMVLRSASVKDIAEKLYLIPQTVHSYRSHIFEKLNVKNDVELTWLALRHNIISIDEGF